MPGPSPPADPPEALYNLFTIADRNVIIVITFNVFLPRDAMLARYICRHVSCVFVCLSHAGIITKPLNVQSEIIKIKARGKKTTLTV